MDHYGSIAQWKPVATIMTLSFGFLWHIKTFRLADVIACCSNHHLSQSREHSTLVVDIEYEILSSVSLKLRESLKNSGKEMPRKPEGPSLQLQKFGWNHASLGFETKKICQWLALNAKRQRCGTTPRIQQLRNYMQFSEQWLAHAFIVQGDFKRLPWDMWHSSPFRGWTGLNFKHSNPCCFGSLFAMNHGIGRFVWYKDHQRWTFPGWVVLPVL